MAAQYTQSGIEAVPEEGLNLAYDRSNEMYPMIPQTTKARSPPREWEREPRICGRRKVTFWLMVALAVTIVIAATVATIAGVVSSRHIKQQKGSGAPEAPEAGSIPQSTSPTPSASAARNCPGSNGSLFTADLSYATATSSAVISSLYEKFCNASVSAYNIKDLALFILNSFDVCNQVCAATSSQMPVSAIYPWKEDAGNDMQRPGTCRCAEGNGLQAVGSDNCDAAIPSGGNK